MYLPAVREVLVFYSRGRINSARLVYVKLQLTRKNFKAGVHNENRSGKKPEDPRRILKIFFQNQEGAKRIKRDSM